MTQIVTDFLSSNTFLAGIKTLKPGFNLALLISFVPDLVASKILEGFFSSTLTSFIASDSFLTSLVALLMEILILMAKIYI